VKQANSVQEVARTGGVRFDGREEITAGGNQTDDNFHAQTAIFIAPQTETT